jgi:glycosyltransferase involved in cell wall biosynthesis
MTPFLSVCILTYNRVGTLKEALDSILPQIANRSDVELLVSDDCSPDPRTAELVQSYCAANPRLRYIRSPVNTGLDGNVVTCIQNAAGEYTNLFSDDDLFPPDYVNRLIEDLTEHRPVVAYINHRAFHNNDPAQMNSPTQPVLKRVFTNPTEYFLYTGLGFMSAVIVKTEEARKHVSKVSHGLSSAHVEIASRTALSSQGPFLFDGTLSVMARYDLNSWYDVLTFGPMNGTRVHEALRDEGLLTQADVDWFNLKAIRLFLPRCIVNNRLNSSKPAPAAELKKLYGRYPQFYRFAYPLALIPPPLLRLLALPMRALKRKRRDALLKRGKLRTRRVHMAPS